MGCIVRASQTRNQQQNEGAVSQAKDHSILRLVRLSLKSGVATSSRSWHPIEGAVTCLRASSTEPGFL